VKLYKLLFLGVMLAGGVATTLAYGQNATGGDAKGGAAVSSGSGAVQYKIGVVNRKKVLEGYNKVKAEYEKLKQEMEGLQKPIDALSNKINGMKEAYDKEKETLTAEQRTEKELEIQKLFSEYQSTLKTNQDLLDAKERALMKTVLGDVDGAVAKLADKEGYHLILEGSGHATAIYFSPTIDVTGKVVEILNSGV